MKRFENWVRFVFDRPVNTPEWYWADESGPEIEDWASSPTDHVRWTIQLFGEPARLLTFTREQVAQGLWFLLGEASPARFGRALYDTTVELDLRMDCIREAGSFFSRYLAARCPAFPGSDGDDLCSICFMWWDLWPDRPDSGPTQDSAAVDGAILEALTAIAAHPSAALKESAIHGLRHMRERQPQRVEVIFDALLADTVGWPDDLVSYAVKAQRGEVQ